MQITDENIRQLKDVVRHETPRLLRLPGVLSVGVALKLRNGVPTETLCVRVAVKKKKPVEPVNINEQRIEDVIRVPGYPVDVIEIEDSVESDDPRICNVPESEARTGTYDVLKGGMAIYAEQDGVKQDYGTLGMIVYDRRSCQQLILTSRDILSSLLISKKGKLEHTELIYQGNSGTPVGESHRSDFDSYKTKDDIIFTSNFLTIKPTGDREVSVEVEGIEFERIFLEPKYGMKVWKSGARTGVTQGLITQVEGYDFRVSGESTHPFACKGDTGAVVFGEKDGVKRPVGLLTQLIDKLGEARCTSLRPALIDNLWLDIGISFDCSADVIHEFLNKKMRAHAYSNVSNGYSDASLSPGYSYSNQKFVSLSKHEPTTLPLYCWYNPVLKNCFYSTDERGEGVISSDDNFIGITAYVCMELQGGMIPLYRYENPVDSDVRLITQKDIPDSIQNGYIPAVGKSVSQSGSQLLLTQGSKGSASKPNKSSDGFLGYATTIDNIRKLLTDQIYYNASSCPGFSLYLLNKFGKRVHYVGCVTKGPDVVDNIYGKPVIDADGEAFVVPGNVANVVWATYFNEYRVYQRRSKGMSAKKANATVLNYLKEVRGVKINTAKKIPLPPIETIQKLIKFTLPKYDARKDTRSEEEVLAFCTEIIITYENIMRSSVLRYELAEKSEDPIIRHDLVGNWYEYKRGVEDAPTLWQQGVLNWLGEDTLEQAAKKTSIKTKASWLFHLLSGASRFHPSYVTGYLAQRTKNQETVDEIVWWVGVISLIFGCVQILGTLGKLMLIRKQRHATKKLALYYAMHMVSNEKNIIKNYASITSTSIATIDVNVNLRNKLLELWDLASGRKTFNSARGRFWELVRKEIDKNKSLKDLFSNSGLEFLGTKGAPQISNLIADEIEKVFGKKLTPRQRRLTFQHQIQQSEGRAGMAFAKKAWNLRFEVWWLHHKLDRNKLFSQMRELIDQCPQ